MRLSGLLVLAAAGFIPVCQASTITYNFSATGCAGPLNGTTANGTLSFDSSIIVPGVVINGAGLSTALNFTWDSVSYHQTTANIGSLKLNAAGALTDAHFGTTCGAGSFSVTPSREQWCVGSAGFGYSNRLPMTFSEEPKRRLLLRLRNRPRWPRWAPASACSRSPLSGRTPPDALFVGARRRPCGGTQLEISGSADLSGGRFYPNLTSQEGR